MLDSNFPLNEATILPFNEVISFCKLKGDSNYFVFLCM